MRMSLFAAVTTRSVFGVGPKLWLWLRSRDDLLSSLSRKLRDVPHLIQEAVHRPCSHRLRRRSEGVLGEVRIGPPINRFSSSWTDKFSRLISVSLLKAY